MTVRVSFKYRQAAIGLSVLLLTSVSAAFAEEAPDRRHPVIGDKPANVITNADILALPESEQQAWIHGAVTMTAQSVASLDKGSARCVTEWYFDHPQTHIRITETMKKYPQSRVSATVYGLAKIACNVL